MFKKIILTLLCAYSATQACQANEVRLRSLFNLHWSLPYRIVFNILIGNLDRPGTRLQNGKGLKWLRSHRTLPNKDLAFPIDDSPYDVGRIISFHGPTTAFIAAAALKWPTLQNHVPGISETYTNCIRINKEAVEELLKLKEKNPDVVVTYCDEVAIVKALEDKLTQAGYDTEKILNNVRLTKDDGSRGQACLQDAYETIKNDPSKEEFRKILACKLYPEQCVPEKYKDKWKFIQKSENQNSDKR